MIVHLNGLPGVGKLTIAQALEKQLIAQDRDVRLIDNHAVINLCYAATDYGTPLYVEMVRSLADLLLRYMVQAPPGRIFILTNALTAEHAADQARYASIQQLALDRGEPFIPVYLTCQDEHEHLRRVATEIRRQRHKLTDPSLAQAARCRTVIHDPAAPQALTLDVSALSADEAGVRIADHLATVPQ